MGKVATTWGFLLLVACEPGPGPASPDATADSVSATCPPAAAVNDRSLGAPCSKDADCRQDLGFFCWSLRDPVRGLPLCVREAFWQDPRGWPDCGKESVWIPDPALDNTKPALCVPKVCAAKFPGTPKQPAIYLHCDKGAADPTTGVGKPCQTMKECQAFGGSTVCPMIVHDDPAYLDFCSPLCGQDADCGPGALCWWRGPGKGAAYAAPHGACVPKACCVYPDCRHDPKYVYGSGG